MAIMHPGDLVQRGPGNGSVPMVFLKQSEPADGVAMLLLQKTVGADRGEKIRVPEPEVYPWPQGMELNHTLQERKVAAAAMIADEVRESVTEAAAAYVREDPDAAPFIDRMLAEAGCPPREKRYVATLTVSVTIEFGTKFDETTAKLVENSLHVSDDEDCIHIMHDADLIDMKLAHSLTGIRVQKLEEN